MKAAAIFLLIAFLASYAIAQTFSVTNKLDRVQAARIAARLRVGMREEDAEKVLAQGGITNGAFKVGCSHGWTSAFILSDGCNLALDIAPKQARADGAWAGGLLRAADIQSNGVKIVSITLTNTRPLQYAAMTTLMPIVRDVLFFGVWFGFPIIVFLPRLKKPEDISKRMVISTLLVWAGLFLHCDFIHVPVGLALAEARGNRNYDGAAYAAAITMFGWVFGIISTVVTACGYLGIQYLKKRQHEHPTT